MWICNNCQNENTDDSLFCVHCGQKKTPVPPTESPAIPDTEKKARGKAPSKLLALILIIAAVAGILVLCYFTVHFWQPATCTEPETCSLCGKVRAPAHGHSWTDATCTEAQKCSICGETGGPALGHRWLDATCTEPRRCSVCGETEGAALGHSWIDATCTEPQRCSVCGATGNDALGHDWIDATYEQPKTCRRCGVKTGDPKGYIGDVPGSWSEKRATIRGSQSGNVFELSSPIKKCFKLSMEITVTDYSGYPFGGWYLYARNLKGKWTHIGKFTLKKETIYDPRTIKFTFDPPVSFDALAVVQQGHNQYSLNYYISFTDAQQIVK